MKLCHIVPSLQVEHGGPSRSVRALSTALARRGWEVELLTSHPDAPVAGVAERDPAGLLVRTFRRDHPARLCPSRGLSAAIAAADADIVHHHALWLRTLHYAAESARGGKPLVISPRGMMSPWAWRHHRWRKALSRHLVHPHALEDARGWHATSQEEADDIRRLGFSQPICVAPNGVEIPVAAEVAAARAEWVRTCPEIATRPTALFYGRFHAKKRVLELLDLWAALPRSDWLLLLVGLPEQYTVAELERHVARQSAADRIRIFSGEGRPAPYGVASLFLLPSHSENFGLTIAEALAHEVPVLVTDATPWTEVARTHCGWCVSWDDYPRVLREALKTAPATRQEMGRAGRAWMAEQFSWDRSAALLQAFYRSLLS